MLPSSQSKGKSMPVLKKPVLLRELVGRSSFLQTVPVRGSQDVIITAVQDIEHAQYGALIVLHKRSYKAHIRTSKASVCITSDWAVNDAPDGMTLLLSDNPYYLFAQILQQIFPQEHPTSYRASTAYIHPDSQIGKDCHIAHGAYIGAGVVLQDRVYVGPSAVLEKDCMIGSDCSIEAGAVLRHTSLGERVSIHSGARLGQEGFGFAIGADYPDIPHLGRVIVGDDVSIGANTCIDRGSLRDTVIGRGTRIDNLVQIGHNCQIGEYCILAGQAGIAGSTVLGNRVAMGGQAGAIGHLEIGEGCKISAASAVLGSLKEGICVSGIPAVETKHWQRQIKFLRRALRNS